MQAAPGQLGEVSKVAPIDKPSAVITLALAFQGNRPSDNISYAESRMIVG